MDTIPSISNIASVQQVRRNIPRRLESIPHIDTSNSTFTLPSPPKNNSVSLHNSLITNNISSENIKELIKQKDDYIKSLTSTNVNLAQMLFDMNDKILNTNMLINKQLEENTKIDSGEMEKLKSSNKKLKDELCNVKHELKELSVSYKHLNNIFVHTVKNKSDEPLSPTQFNKLKSEFNDYKEKLNCRICFDKKINVTVEPCGHTAICEDCVNNLRTHNTYLKCPLCNTFITRYKRIYLPI